jgi:hypothetical protein
MNDFAWERLEVNEGYENKNRAHVVYTAADQFHPLSNETKCNQCRVLLEILWK